MKHPRIRVSAVTLLILASATSVARCEDRTSPPSDVSRQDGSLSTKLNATSGVIHPEGTVDPGIQKTPPATGNMPVVTPPGTPGGRQDVVPK